MAVGFRVKHYWYSIGTGDFLHGFFSTVCANLENSKWGSRFPTLMKTLYQGELSSDRFDDAAAELQMITQELAALPPQRVVWDIEDRRKMPPWGDAISPEITSLRNYFVTSSGEDFIDVFAFALGKAKELDMPLWIGTL